MDGSSRIVIMSKTESSSSLRREAIDDELQALSQQERHYIPCIDYFLQHSSCFKAERGSDCVNEGWRRKICEWAFEVVDHFAFDREVVSIALNYLDRVVAIKTKSSNTATSRRQFQLVAVTSLYLAIKLHGEVDTPGGQRRKLKIHAFVELSRGLFQVDTLEQMEREILTLLNWRVNPPTPARIVATLLKLLPDHDSSSTNAANAIFEMAKYLTELSVCVSDTAFQYKPSVIAYASVLCAMDALQDSLALSYDTKVTFLNEVAGSVSLTPTCIEVQEAQLLLMELCPAMFNRMNHSDPVVTDADEDAVDGLPNDGGKSSPVCICEQMQQDFVTRKRGRSTADT